MKHNRDWPAEAGSYLFLVMIVLLYGLPLLYLINVSLKTRQDFFIDPTAVTRTLAIGNFAVAVKRGNLLHYTLNSLLYTLASGALTMAVCLPAAFPISRNYVRRSNLWYSFFVAGLFLPNALVPQFRLMLWLGLQNTRIGYILLKVIVGIVFFIFTGYLRSLPREFDDVAGIDGCGYFRYLFTIVLPLMKPAVFSGLILHSIQVWNDIIGGVIYLTNKEYYPVVRGLFSFYGQYGNDWPPLAAAILIVALPLLALYLSFQSYIIDGATAGAFKG